MPLCSATKTNGEPCAKYAVDGGDRCAFHQDEKVGTQSKFTPEIVDQLVSLLRAGNYMHVSARAAGISMALFKQWVERGKSDAPGDVAYREFRERIELARAEAEARNVALISRAASETWQAAAWLLERQYPERWGRVSVRARDDAPPTDVPIVDADDPFREVDELAEKRRTRGAG